jgi:hypothetical protein
VHPLVEASADQAWSYAGSIMTFLLPMIAFVFIAGALLILYTKPELVPGRRVPGAEVSVGATRQPGLPTSAGKTTEGPGDGQSVPGTGAGTSGESVSAE